MTPKEIVARVGTQVTAEEMADMVRSNPVTSTAECAGLRSGVLEFTFGPGGVVLTDAFIRKHPTEDQK